MTRNLCKKVLSEGGTLTPLIISNQDSKGLGLMNPSIFLDKTKILLNLRNINYTLYHSENNQIFNNRWGPLVYLNPENDLHLRTYNFYCELDPKNLNISKYYPIDTSTFDIEPVWEFVGLEDARYVRWDGKLFACGVRRDTKPNGEGRMELSELIEKNPDELKPEESPIKEINRFRIQPPGNPTYCEKNWMPIIDMPYHFVKWCNPTQVVKVNTNTCTSETVFLSKSHIPDIPDFRGSSQVINYKDYRMCVIHEVNLFNNKLQQKDATYMHRFIIWDKEWNLIKMSEPFSFMDGEIEFCCGMALYNKDLLISFGFQDNAAYVLKVPEKIIDEILGFTKPELNWGIINSNHWFKTVLTNEIFVNNIYQKFFKVEKNDIVVDVGASVGPFTYSILDKKPKNVFCIEPSKELFSTLLKNTKHNSIICINKGISYKEGIHSFSNIHNPDSNSLYYTDSFKFKTFIDNYNISKIDFLKTDCGGGEYDIFNVENLVWIKQNVKKIAGEFHLNTPEYKEKFKNFRNTYLKEFINYQVYSMDNIDIKWDLWNDHFLEYYAQIMLYVDNREDNHEITKENNKSTFSLKNFSTSIKKEKKLNNYWKTAKWATFEITTNILSRGCIMSCVFCPQKTLINAYKGERMLAFDNFKNVINKIPKEITIIFSGFSEPWLNKKCSDMVLYAYEKGRNISIFTTGIGMDIEDFDKIKHIPFVFGPKNPVIGNLGKPVNNGGFVLHLPDNELYAKHPITEKYIKLLEHIKQHENEISNFRLTSMGTVHDKIKYIFPTALPIETWGRANNLINEQKLRSEITNIIKDKYKTCYQEENSISCACDERLYHNVLLPNGDVVLCCMDYNLENILGNLFTQEFDDILPAPETKYNLCKFCENSTI